jgi:hypothetical protein
MISTASGFTSSRMSLALNVDNKWTAIGRRTDSEALNVVNSPTEVEPGRIYFVAARFGYSTQALDLFVDGELVATTSIPSWTSSSSDTEPMGAAIGARSDGATSYYDGTLDDIRIYHHLLTDEDIRTLYIARGRDRMQAYVRWKLREDASGYPARREIRDAGAAQSDGATDTFIDTYPIYATENLVSAYPRRP